MEIGLEIIDTADSFHKSVIMAICIELNYKLADVADRIRDEVAKNIKPVFENTEEYLLLTTDKDIMADIGLEHGKEKEILDKIIQRVADSIQVKFNHFLPVGNNISGSIDIFILISDFSDVLDLPEAKIKSENGTDDWLKWILIDGPSIRIDNYHVEYGKHGRSGLGHMVLSGVWTLDKRLQGTKSKNWLTNALDKNESMVRDIISDAVEKEILRVL